MIGMTHGISRGMIESLARERNMFEEEDDRQERE
jgi:hypothetical protein